MNIADEVVDCRLLSGPADSASRANKLRSLLHPDVDALLLVAGIDSKDEIANTLLINFLLCGTHDAQLAVPALEDTMIVLSRDQSFVYTTPPALQFVAHAVAAWGCVEVVCMRDAGFADQYLFEEHKMDAFRSMTASFSKVGVVFDETVARSSDPVKVIEKWPIVQSFAVDDRGQRPFFTMAKKVTNLYLPGSPLWQVLMSLDELEAARVALHDASMMRFQWNSALESIDRERSAVAADASRAVALATEPLQAFLTYGAMAIPAAFASLRAAQTHRVAAPVGRIVSLGSGPEATPALVLTAENPRGTLKLTRTYPLSVVSEGAAALSTLLCAIKDVLATGAGAGGFDEIQQRMRQRPECSNCSLTTHELGFAGAVFIEVTVNSGDLLGVAHGDTFVAVRGALVNVSGAIAPLTAFAATSGEIEAERRSHSLGATTIGKTVDEVSPSDGLTLVTSSGAAATGTLVLGERGLLIRSRRLGSIGPISVLDPHSDAVLSVRFGDISDKLLLRIAAPSLSGVLGGALWLVARPSSFARRVIHKAVTEWKANAVVPRGRLEDLVMPAETVARIEAEDPLSKSSWPKRPAFDAAQENIEASWREQRQFLHALLAHVVPLWPASSVHKQSTAVVTTGGSVFSAANAGVVVVSASPGANIASVVSRLQLAAQKTSVRRVVVFDPVADGSPCALDSAKLAATLVEAGKESGTLAIVLSPFYCPIEATLHAVFQARHVGGANVAVHSVIGVVATNLYYNDYGRQPPRHVAPGVTFAFSPGLLTHLLFLSKTGTAPLLSRIENSLRDAHSGCEFVPTSLYNLDALDADFLQATSSTALTSQMLTRSRDVRLPAPVKHHTVRIEREPMSPPATLDFAATIRGGLVFPDVLFVDADVVFGERRTRLMAASGNAAFTVVEEGGLDANLIHTFTFYGHNLSESQLSTAVNALKLVRKKE